MNIDPNRLAVEYYFGDLQYWKLPQIAIEALERGHDGPALKRLAAMAGRPGNTLREEGIPSVDIDSCFREMGVDAPIPKEKARLALAIESARRVIDGGSNVFDEATYIRIHLCELSEPPDALRQIVHLSKTTQNAARSQWSQLQTDLHEAFAMFLNSQDPE